MDTFSVQQLWLTLCALGHDGVAQYSHWAPQLSDQFAAEADAFCQQPAPATLQELQDRQAEWFTIDMSQSSRSQTTAIQAHAERSLSIQRRAVANLFRQKGHRR